MGVEDGWVDWRVGGGAAGERQTEQAGRVEHEITMAKEGAAGKQQKG